MPLPETVAADFNEFAGKLQQGLPNDRQKAAFEHQRNNVALNLDGTVRRHVFQQIQQYDAAETQSAIENNIQNAITNANDPRLIGQSLDKALQAAQGFAKRNGIGPAEAQKQIAGIQEATHVGVISALLAQDNTKAASVYFEEARDSGQLKGKALTRVEEALHVGQVKKQAQTQADRIIDAGGTLRAQLDKARAIEDTDVQDAVVRRIEHADAVNDKATRDAEEQRLTSAYDIVRRTGRVEAIPSSDLAKLGSHLPGLYSFANAQARGVPIETDSSTYYRLMDMAVDDPEKFIKQPLLGFSAQLGKEEFNKLAGIRLSLASGDKAKAEKDLAGSRTTNQILEDTLTQYGLDPNPKPGTADAKAIAQLRRMLDVRVETEMAGSKTGAKPQSTDIQKMLDDLLSQKSTVKGSWWNLFPGGQPFYDKDTRLLDLTIEDVPAAERTIIEGKLRARGKPISPVTILDTYIEAESRKPR